MLGRINSGCLILVVAGALLLPAPQLAQAQAPAVVAYYPAVPAVAYVPEARGLFGLRTVYRPVVAYPMAAPVAVPVTPAPVAAYYAPAAPVTAYYAPPAASAVYYAPAAPATTYYPPAAVTTYYAPAGPFAPVIAAPQPVTVHYAPRPVVTYSVIVP